MYAGRADIDKTALGPPQPLPHREALPGEP
jgi:hypothetical protein